MKWLYRLFRWLFYYGGPKFNFYCQQEKPEERRLRQFRAGILKMNLHDMRR